MVVLLLRNSYLTRTTKRWTWGEVSGRVWLRSDRREDALTNLWPGWEGRFWVLGRVGDDEDITSSDITMTTLCTNQIKVHMFCIRFTYYIFEQTLLHNEFWVFLFTEVLAWAKEKRPSVTNKWMIKEVDWGPNQDLLQVYFYLTTSLLVQRRQEIKLYTFWIRIRAS